MSNTSTHQALIYGATANFFFTPMHSTKSKVRQRAIRLITSYAQAGYTFSNPEIIFSLKKEDLIRFDQHLGSIIQSTTKEAFFLRPDFGTSTKLEAYTDEDYLAIFAQYSITYGWSSQYTNLFNTLPETVLESYIGDAFDKEASIFPAKTKEITIMLPEQYEAYILSILEAKIPLRAHQEAIIQSVDFSLYSFSEAKYSIKSTKSFVQNCQYAQGIDPTINNLDEMQRFILTNCQKGDNGEDYTGQILSPMLKSFKFHIPTRMKKYILRWFQLHPENKHNSMVESMYSNETWWKRMFLHCHWCNASKFEKRYPRVKSILNLLYSEDRSWTFNSRYAAAQSQADYAAAIEILAEKPGLLMRNLLIYCKYMKGVPLPVKANSNVPKRSTVPMNPLTWLLSHTKTEQSTPTEVVGTDASHWLMEVLPDYLLEYKPTVKNVWQLVETLLEEVHEKPITTRTVQGQTVNYSTPIPAIDKSIRDNVITSLTIYISETKRATNTNLGKVYLEPELEGIALQYSGANSNEMSMSGCFLTPGTVLPLPAGDFIRMGVVWRDVGAGSCDIDLSTTLATARENHTCYYGTPECNINGNLVATSSGDITSCGTATYSAEFIDIDINLAKQSGVQSLFNSLVMYSGSKNIDSYDTHAFLSVIDATDRVMNSRKITIDLAKQDYAVKLTDPVSGYLGFSIDLVNDSMKSLAIGSNRIARGSNAAGLLGKFAKQISTEPARLNMLSTITESIDPTQLVANPADADVIIGISKEATINAVTHGEEIQQIIF